MARKKYSHRVVALGLDPMIVERNITSWRDRGWTLISTYMDRNRATIGQEQSVIGIFETWEKVKRRG